MSPRPGRKSTAFVGFGALCSTAWREGGKSELLGSLLGGITFNGEPAENPHTLPWSAVSIPDLIRLDDKVFKQLCQDLLRSPFSRQAFYP